MKKVSLKDIAALAGVSYATVSLVLTGKDKNGRVSEATATKIKDIATKLGYRPNLVAKNLRTGETKSIGLLVADISIPFFSLLAKHIQNELEKDGYVVIIVNTNEDKIQMKKMIDFLVLRQVDGLIVVPTENSEPTIEQLISDDIPFVLLDRCFTSLNTINVLADNFGTVFSATNNLIEEGATNNLFINYDNSLSNFNERERGYKEATIRQNYSVNIERVNYNNARTEINYIIDSIANESKKYDSLIFANSSIAIYAIDAIMQREKVISKSLKLVCFDKCEPMNYLPFPTLCITQPIEEMGKESSRLILEMIKK